MKNTWFKCYRSIVDDVVFDDPETLKVWIWILCKASYKKDTVLIGRCKVDILPGQLLFGRKSAAEELKMSESKVYRTAKLLERLGCITIKSNNKFSLINVVKWGFFQCDYEETEQQVNNKRTASEQQVNTSKEVKEIYNIYKSSSSARTRARTNPQSYPQVYPQTLGGTIGKGVLVLTDAQMDELLEIMPLDVFDKYCDKLTTWIVRKGRNVKNHYELIKRWYSEDYGGENEIQKQEDYNC